MSSKESDTRTRILDATWKVLEDSKGQGVRMSDIAKAAGISRQAVYLHFENRTDLLIATIHHVDEVKELDGRLQVFLDAPSGLAGLDALVDVWGNYIPEIYGIAKALLGVRDTDEAAAAAWADSMGCLRAACEAVVNKLKRDGALAAGWSVGDATEMMLTALSVQTWEQLTGEFGWAQKRYVARTKALLHGALTQP